MIKDTTTASEGAREGNSAFIEERKSEFGG
jgi:hypothetical protein